MNDNPTRDDGMHGMVPLERMSEAARKLRALYARIPGAPFYRREFYVWPETIERWLGEGVPLEVSYANYLHYRRRCVELGG